MGGGGSSLKKNSNLNNSGYMSARLPISEHPLSSGANFRNPLGPIRNPDKSMVSSIFKSTSYPQAARNSTANLGVIPEKKDQEQSPNK